MSVRKVTFFDKDGEAIELIDEEGQAKPCVFGVHWVNTDTLETIRARGGQRTGPRGELLEKIPPTTTLSPFFAGGFYQDRTPDDPDGPLEGSDDAGRLTPKAS
jgi:hypothetical protein